MRRHTVGLTDVSPWARIDGSADPGIRAERPAPKYHPDKIHAKSPSYTAVRRDSSLKSPFQSERAETIQCTVGSNLGVTLLPEMVLRRSAPNLVMARIQPPTPDRAVVVTWRPRRYLSTSDPFLFNSSADIVSILWRTFANISISACSRSALSFSMQPSAGPASR